MAISTINTNAVAPAAILAANLGPGAPTRLQMPTGSLIQIATNTVDGVLSTTNAGGPASITAGMQVFSISFTPTYANSILLVQTSAVAISEETNTGNLVWLALWDGNTLIAANSGQANYLHYTGNMNVAHLSINNSYISGSTIPRIIQIRGGLDVGQVYINGSGTHNYTGSSARIQMNILEIAP